MEETQETKQEKTIGEKIKEVVFGKDTFNKTGYRHH